MATDHPDRAWIEATVTSLLAWLDVESHFPTSEITGGGAVGHVEQRLSQLHGGRPTLLVPSATYGMRSALAALGVRQDDEVLVPQLDWPATIAAVRSLGATPVPVPVAGDTMTIDPQAAAERCTPHTRAVVACHLLGVPADVPALRAALPRISIVEDCAQAFGSALDGERVGTLGDAAVFSFGPGKTLDAGEAGAVVLRDSDVFVALLRQSAHPVRQRVSGLDPEAGQLSVRVHPVAAVLLNRALDGIDTGSLVAGQRRLASLVTHHTGLKAIGADPRRGVAARGVAVNAAKISSPLLRRGWTQGRLDLTDIASLIQGTLATHPVTVVSEPRSRQRSTSVRRSTSPYLARRMPRTGGLR